MAPRWWYLRRGVAWPALLGSCGAALAFAVAFFWPIFAMTRPSATFHFLYLSWVLSLLVLFAVSRGNSADAPGGVDERTSERTVGGTDAGDGEPS